MKLYNVKRIQPEVPKHVRLLTPENRQYVVELRKLLGLQ